MLTKPIKNYACIKKQPNKLPRLKPLRNWTKVRTSCDSSLKQNFIKLFFFQNEEAPTKQHFFSKTILQHFVENIFKKT